MIRTIAIDDEPLALELVSGYISRTPFLEFSGMFSGAYPAITYIEKHEVDLIFLDIQMPDIKGTEFVKLLEKGPKIIFTTAYEKYAIEGFKLEAIDYLLKPFSYDEFLIATKKARRLIELESNAIETKEKESESNFLFVKSDYKTKRINYNEILYIEGLKDYVKIYLKQDPKPILSINSLKSLEEKLPGDQFMRIHRSYIVNLDLIDTIERSRIVFGKTYVPIGDQYKEKFQDFLDKNFL